MPELIEREDGTLVLRTNADPAGAGHRQLGFRRLSVGLDVGGRGADPSALSIIKAESVPYQTGRGFEQALSPTQYTVVYTETAKLDEGVDVVEWTVSVLRKLKNWTFTMDATGMGAPLVGLFEQAKVPVNAVTMTAGASINRKGNRITCSKNLMFENIATCLENGTLQIAHDLPEKEELIREIMSVEYAQSSSGALRLQGGGKGHHADLMVASSLALLSETHIAPQRFEVAKLQG